MACPYSSKNNTLELRHRYEPDTPMSHIVPDLFVELKVKFKKKQVKAIVDILEQHGVTRLYHLGRVTDEEIEALVLPNIIERQLIKLSENFRTKTPSKKRRERSCSHASTMYLPNISKKEKRLILDAYDWLMDTESRSRETQQSRLTHFSTNMSSKLFSQDPVKKQAFPSKLKATLAVGKNLGHLIKVIDDPVAFHSIAKGLGITHRVYGVSISDFDTMRVAYANTLRECMDDKWSEELEAAWLKLYDWVAALMTNVMDKPSVYSGHIYYCTDKKKIKTRCKMDNDRLIIYGQTEPFSSRFIIPFKSIEKLSEKVAGDILVPNSEYCLTLHLEHEDPVVLGFKNGGEYNEWKLELGKRIEANQTIEAQADALKRCPERKGFVTQIFARLGFTIL